MEKNIDSFKIIIYNLYELNLKGFEKKSSYGRLFRESSFGERG